MTIHYSYFSSYVSFEQRVNNLVRYAGEFPVNALKVAICSRICKCMFIGNQLSFRNTSSDRISYAIQ